MENYRAAMVLSAVGDSLGFRGGTWEFCKSGARIHEELDQLGGLQRIAVRPPQWPVSDDTVLHMATARALVHHGHHGVNDALFMTLAREYKDSMRYMNNRAVGVTTEQACHYLDTHVRDGYKLPFNPKGGGAGAAMRAMCIGLRFPRPEQIDDLRKVSIEAGRMTHHHPTGYLGSFASALFTSFAIQKRPVQSWGHNLIRELDNAKAYISNNSDIYREDNLREWNYFSSKWTDYLQQRDISDGRKAPYFPRPFDVIARDRFYNSLSYNGWAGSSGHDAPMIAYDAMLGCKGNWEELCSRAMFHGGDSDTTGAIAGALFGAMYGFRGVPERNDQYVEFRQELLHLADNIFSLSG